MSFPIIGWRNVRRICYYVKSAPEVGYIKAPTLLLFLSLVTRAIGNKEQDAKDLTRLMRQATRILERIRPPDGLGSKHPEEEALVKKFLVEDGMSTFFNAQRGKDWAVRHAFLFINPVLPDISIEVGEEEEGDDGGLVFTIDLVFEDAALGREVANTIAAQLKHFRLFPEGSVVCHCIEYADGFFLQAREPQGGVFATGGLGRLGERVQVFPSSYNGGGPIYRLAPLEGEGFRIYDTTWTAHLRLLREPPDNRNRHADHEVFCRLGGLVLLYSEKDKHILVREDSRPDIPYEPW